MRGRLKSQGHIDLATVKDGALQVAGWAASRGSGPIDAFRISYAGKTVDALDVVKGLPSPDVKAVFPDLDRAETCRFQIRVPLGEAERRRVLESAVTLTPMVGGRPGAPITGTASEPSDVAVEPSDIETPAVITEEMRRENRAVAGRHGVEPAVHPKDFMYWFCVNGAGPTGPAIAAAINYYFEDGGRSAAKLAEVVAELGFEEGRRIRLLEFASGYGCVSRHLKARPQFDLTSCDIHPEAIDFLADQIGVKAKPSVHAPEEFSAPEKYDVVFALSFFSHMPKVSFGRWVRALFDALDAPGYLIFTTHGLKTRDLALADVEIPADGFWFRPSSEQGDLDTAEYGTTLTTPDFVAGEITRRLGAPIVAYKHAYWWQHQDLWVVKRER